MTLDANGLSGLKVKDLQRELKKRGLDTSGLKAVLLQRLKDSLEQEVDTKVVEQEEDETVEKKEEEKNSEKEENGVEKRVTEKETQVDSEDKPKEEPANAAKKKNEVDEDKPEPATGLKRGVDDVDTKEDESEGDAKKPKPEEDASNSKNEDNDKTAATGLKRDANEVNRAENEEERNVKKPKLEDDAGNSMDEDGGNAFKANDEKAGDEDAEATEDEPKKTLRIDNFVRPFTLNAVKALVQELGDFVEDGFWMDTIKTHCYVTYSSAEIAKKTSAALDGKVWPPENGRSLRVKLVDHTAMEVSQHGEAHLSDRPTSRGSNGAPASQRQKVTIDEFFQKTETKPVLYYLPLTDEQVKERQSEQRKGEPRKRRHRGGRKRNRRGRFQRR